MYYLLTFSILIKSLIICIGYFLFRSALYLVKFIYNLENYYLTNKYE